MKLVTAVVKPAKLDDVKHALREVGVTGMTVTEVHGVGHQVGHTEVYRGAEYAVDMIPKVKLEILCDVFDAERIVSVLAAAARTDTVGDGKIWIVDVDVVQRISTGQVGAEAL